MATLELGTRVAGAGSVMPWFRDCVQGVLTPSALIWCAAWTTLCLWATTLAVRKFRE